MPSKAAECQHNLSEDVVLYSSDLTEAKPTGFDKFSTHKWWAKISGKGCEDKQDSSTSWHSRVMAAPEFKYKPQGSKKHAK